MNIRIRRCRSVTRAVISSAMRPAAAARAAASTCNPCPSEIEAVSITCTSPANFWLAAQALLYVPLCLLVTVRQTTEDPSAVRLANTSSKAPMDGWDVWG